MSSQYRTPVADQQVCQDQCQRLTRIASSQLSAQARHEVLQCMAPRYQQASASYKGALLDEVVTITGYARRSAIRLLNHPPQGSRPQKRRRQATYGPEVQHVSFLLWHHVK